MIEGLVLSLALTQHIDASSHYNDVHPTISYNYKGYSVGMYHNSISSTSYFVSKHYKMSEDINIQYGLASGYYKPAVPMIVVRKQVATNLNVIVMPGIEIDNSRKTPILVLGIEYKLGN